MNEDVIKKLLANRHEKLILSFSKIKDPSTIEQLLIETARESCSDILNSDEFSVAVEVDGWELATDQLIYEMTTFFVVVVESIEHMKEYAIEKSGSVEQMALEIVYSTIKSKNVDGQKSDKPV